MKNKNFGAKKVLADGYKFDSQKEYQDYLLFKHQLNRGQISKIEVHRPFILIPGIYYNFETRTYRIKNGSDNYKKSPLKWVCIQKSKTYTADFVIHYPDGSVKVFDSKPVHKNPNTRKKFEKSMIFKRFLQKKRLMMYIYGIEVKVI